MEIECPKCGEGNDVPQPENLVCIKCNASLGGGRFAKPTKKLVSAWVVFLLGAGSAVGATQYVTNDRYPMLDEHAFIETCVNGSSAVLSSKKISKKREVCVCVLEDMQDEFDYGEYKKDENLPVIMEVFNQSLRKCL